MTFEDMQRAFGRLRVVHSSSGVTGILRSYNWPEDVVTISVDEPRSSLIVPRESVRVLDA